MNFEFLFPLLVTLTIAEMMFAMGLRLSFSTLAQPLRSEPWLVARSFAANYLAVPLIALLLLSLFRADASASAGLLILAVCPAAPYGPPFTVIARGNLALATALMVILAAASAVLAPALLHLLLPLVSGDDEVVRVDATRLVSILFIIQLLPLGAGLAIGQWRQAWSVRLIKPATRVSQLLNALMIAAIVLMQYNVILDTGWRELALMFLLVVTAAFAGWIFGFPGSNNRLTLSMITGMRNMSLSMGIAATAFPGSPAMTTILAYSFVAGTGMLAYAYAARRRWSLNKD